MRSPTKKRSSSASCSRLCRHAGRRQLSSASTPARFGSGCCARCRATPSSTSWRASGFRVVTGSANLSFAALTGGSGRPSSSAMQADHRRFMAYYTQSEERSDPVAADLLVVSSDQPDGPRLAVPDNALDVEKVHAFVSCAPQGAIVESPQATRHAGALRRGHAARERAWHGAPPALARPQPERCHGSCRPGFARAWRAHSSRPIHREDRPGPGRPDRPRDEA